MILLFFRHYYKSILIGALIVWLSLSGGNSIMPGKFLNIPYIDKIGHFFMYMLFSGVLLLDSCHWQKNGRIYYSLLLIPLFFGALMEILQLLLTQSRKAEMLDLVADIAGIVTGIVFALIVKKLLR